MKQADYSGVKALLAVDRPDLRADLLAAFGRAGIGEVLQAATEDQLLRTLSDADLDLIVMTHELQGAFVGTLISRLRRGEIGTRPFPIVVILVESTDPDLRRRISDCGPDDIVALPVSPVDLLDRIGIHIAGERKPLVVTTAYAGPERRTRKRTMVQ